MILCGFLLPKPKKKDLINKTVVSDEGWRISFRIWHVWVPILPSPLINCTVPLSILLPATWRQHLPLRSAWCFKGGDVHFGTQHIVHSMWLLLQNQFYLKFVSYWGMCSIKIVVKKRKNLLCLNTFDICWLIIKKSVDSVTQYHTAFHHPVATWFRSHSWEMKRPIWTLGHWHSEMLFHWLSLQFCIHMEKTSYEAVNPGIQK